MTAYEAYLELIKYNKPIKSIDALYSNLVNDIDLMQPKQIKMLANRILTRVSKINTNEIENLIATTKNSLFYDKSKDTGDYFIEKIQTIKEYLYSVLTPETNEETSEVENKKVNEVKSKYEFLQKMINSADSSMVSVLKEAKRLDNLISRVNFEDLSDDEYNEILEIKNEVDTQIQELEGLVVAERYQNLIKQPLIDTTAHIITLGNKAKAEIEVNKLLDIIQAPPYAAMFEPMVRKIISRKVKPTEFKTFFYMVMGMYREMIAENNNTSEQNFMFESFSNFKKKVYAINETYESYQELNILSEEIFNYFIKNKNKRAQLLQLSDISTKKFTVINDFIKFPIGIILLPKNTDIGGSFCLPTEYPYLLKILKKYNVSIELNEIRRFKLGIIIIYEIDKLKILHELQHAYDNYRAKGKFLNTKLGQRLKDKSNIISSIGADKTKTLDIENLLDTYTKTYFRSPHEMSAYFVTAVNMINFFRDKEELFLRDFNDIYEEFKDTYQGYKYLTPKDKKILARKLSQYYYKLKERNIHETD